MSGILPSIIYPSTVADEQKRLAAALDGTNASVVACASLAAPTRTGWGLFYSTALGFTQETPGFFGLGTMMDRAQSYEDELLAWQNKLAQAGCSLGVPLFNPNPPPTSALQALQYLAWGAGALGGAYILGQIFSFIPRPRRR
jgi:hypothetical protein